MSQIENTKSVPSFSGSVSQFIASEPASQTKSHVLESFKQKVQTVIAEYKSELSSALRTITNTPCIIVTTPGQNYFLKWVDGKSSVTSDPMQATMFSKKTAEDFTEGQDAEITSYPKALEGSIREMTHLLESLSD